MAYDQTDVGSIRFLIGDAIMQLTRVVMQPGTDVAEVDTEMNYLHELTSFFTAQDPKFKEELEAAKPPDYKPGWNSVADMQFRMASFGCIVRSVCRQGVLTKPELPTSDFKPTSTKKPLSPVQVTA